MDGTDAAGLDTQGISDALKNFSHETLESLSAAWDKAVGAARTPQAASHPASPAAPAAEPPPAPRLHVVRSGETLSGIAHHYGTDWHSLARANHISDPTELRVGTALRLPASTTAKPTHQAAPTPPAKPSTDPAAPRAPGSIHLGDLSMRFETGYRPGQEAKAAGVVSNGAGDKGGVSYGAFQLASSAKGGHQVQAFLKAEGAPWAAAFGGKDPTTHSGAFAAQWKQTATQEPDKFFAAQHSYIERTHYQPVADHVQAATGLDISSRSPTVQNAVWSMSVQHGKAASLVDDAVRQAGPQGNQSNTEYDRKLVNALYDVRNDYVDAIGQPNLKARYAQERQEALQQLR